MKQLLGWMHRKFRENSSEPFPVGYPCSCLSKQPSIEEHQFFPKPNYGSKPTKQLPQKVRNSFTGSLDSMRIEEDEVDYFNEDGSSTAISGFFDGLLTIGTLGLDNSVTNEPETPTFFSSAENVAEKETELTENDLKLINEELEKVLGADARDDKYGNSDFSSARTSHCTTITLSGNENQVLSGRDSNAICPLEGYLFGSPIDLPAERTKKTKKEHRASLGELFQKSKIEEKMENKEENKFSKDTGEKSVKNLLKWKLLRSSTTTSATSVASDSVSGENKLPKKLLQMFNRKVHPESSLTTKRTKKSHKNEIENKNKNRGIYKKGGPTMEDNEDIIMVFPRWTETETEKERVINKDGNRCNNSHSNPPSFDPNGNHSNGKREYWIKTDADYLVLEL